MVVLFQPYMQSTYNEGRRAPEICDTAAEFYKIKSYTLKTGACSPSHNQCRTCFIQSIFAITGALSVLEFICFVPLRTGASSIWLCRIQNLIPMSFHVFLFLVLILFVHSLVCLATYFLYETKIAEMGTYFFPGHIPLDTDLFLFLKVDTWFTYK